MKISPVLITVLLAAIAARSEAANVLVSTQTGMLVVDANHSGAPDAGDCVFTATVNPPSLTFTNFASSATQGTTALHGCGGTAGGTVSIGQDTSSDFAFVNITSASNPAPSSMPWALTGLFHAPIGVDIFEEVAAAPNGLPMAPNAFEVQIAAPVDPLATFQICSSNGAPAVLVGGLALLRLQLAFFPDAQNPTHVRIPNIPLLKVAGGFDFFDAYIPVVNRAITVAFDNDPSSLIVDLPLDALAPCPSRTAPALTLGAVTVVGAGLLFAGVAALRRRSYSKRVHSRLA